MCIFCSENTRLENNMESNFYCQIKNTKFENWCQHGTKQILRASQMEDVLSYMAC